MKAASVVSRAGLVFAAAALIAALPAARASADGGAAGHVVSVEASFAFDSVELSPQGRAALDALAKNAADAGYRFMDISANADPLGTVSYNRSLSERRAEVVRDYLVQDGIDVHRMRTRGLGSSQPATTDAQCAGLPRARRIECLQPDRSAEITVVGVPDGVSYISGGATNAEAQALKHEGRSFPLELVFTAGRSSGYVSRVQVRVSDASGSIVLDATSDGPIMLVRLPTATYRIRAANAGRALERTVRVDATGFRRVDFHWRSS
jgi:outer membrane protein OmpA-like peptidoglycan-associated protein